MEAGLSSGVPSPFSASFSYFVLKSCHCSLSTMVFINFPLSSLQSSHLITTTCIRSQQDHTQLINGPSLHPRGSHRLRGHPLHSEVQVRRAKSWPSSVPSSSPPLRDQELAGIHLSLPLFCPVCPYARHTFILDTVTSSLPRGCHPQRGPRELTLELPVTTLQPQAGV